MYAIKFSGVMSGKKKEGYVHPEVGEFIFTPHPTWISSDLTTTRHICAAYNRKANTSNYKIEQVFPVHSKSLSVVSFETPYWTRVL